MSLLDSSHATKWNLGTRISDQNNDPRQPVTTGFHLTLASSTRTRTVSGILLFSYLHYIFFNRKVVQLFTTHHYAGTRQPRRHCSRAQGRHGVRGTRRGARPTITAAPPALCSHYLPCPTCRHRKIKVTVSTHFY